MLTSTEFNVSIGNAGTLGVDLLFDFLVIA